jgi:hypothetical protein
LKHRVVLSLTGLVLVVCLGIADLLSAPPLSSQQHLVHAQALMQQANEQLKELAAGEARGEADDFERLLAMNVAIAEARAHIDQAADAGEVLALFWQSGLHPLTGGHDETPQSESCVRLHQAVDQGFLAAAIAYQYRCRPAAKGFEYTAEQAEQFQALRRALERDDPFLSLYPQVLRESRCSTPPNAFSVQLPGGPRWFSEAVEASTRSLTYDMYKAEGLYLLAMQPDLALSERLALLRQSEALGCKKGGHWRQRLESELARERS